MSDLSGRIDLSRFCGFSIAYINLSAGKDDASRAQCPLCNFTGQSKANGFGPIHASTLAVMKIRLHMQFSHGIRETKKGSRKIHGA